MRYALLALLLVACNPNPQPNPTPTPTASPTAKPTKSPSVSPITHIVIVIQENRTVDNLLQGVPGLNTASSGQGIALVPVSLTAAWDIEHSHPAWLAAYNNGGMDGWNNEPCKKSGVCPPNAPYAYVPPAEVQPYYSLCETYTCADEMFQTNQGPSFPAHQYFVSGTSTIVDNSPLRASENPTDNSGGCDSPTKVTVSTIDPYGTEVSGVTKPCFIRASIFTLLNNAGLSWRYYQSGSAGATTKTGFWKAVDALQPIRNSTTFAGVIAPPSQFLTDVASGQLAAVTFVTPTGNASDHAGETNGTGPAWVASVVNAIGGSPFWGSTAIFITWDDWGGWYDHVAPQVLNSYELGFRVPFIAVSPYARVAFIDHAPHEFGSILHYTEETFGLPSLGTTDARADDLSNEFDYTQSPTPFVPIGGAKPRAYWQAHHDDRPVDD